MLLPCGVAGLILYTQRLPFPYEDDYKAILAFAYNYEHAPDLSTKLLEIALVQYNFYKLLFQHAVVASELALTHHINFAFLTSFGDLFLVGIFGLLWCSFERQPLKSKLIRFLPISLLFFSLTYWETLNWAMAALQNIPVIFFALLSIYFLAPPKTTVVQRHRFLFSCLAASLSCCASANGFLLAPVGLLVLASRGRFKHISLWICSFILPLAAYLYQPTIEPVRHPSLLKQLFFFIAFFGGAFAWRPVAFITGIFSLMMVAWAARSRFLQKSPIFFPFALWIVLTGALLETVRASINSRYSIYSVLMLVCCYVFQLRWFEQNSLTRKLISPATITLKRFVGLAIAFSFCFYGVTAVWAYHHLHQRRKSVLSGLRFYRADPLVNSPQLNPTLDILYPDEKPFELLMLNRAAQDNLYTAPSTQDLGR